MRSPLPTRRLLSGVPCAFLAMVLVLARLLAPAIAMPQTAVPQTVMPQTGAALAVFDRLAREAICHAAPEGSGGPAREAPAGHGDCLLCPACHLVAAAALPTSAGPGLPLPRLAPIGLVAPPPSATGPPPARRFATPPTGPPARSA